MSGQCRPRPFSSRLSRYVAGGLLMAVVIWGCVTPPVSMETPTGFAPYSDPDTLRVISPEGVVLRARDVPNDPPQSLKFWAEALERHLTDAGYLLVDRAEMRTASADAVLLEWLAPVSEDDWIYLTAISVIGTRIAIVEAAGPANYYEDYRLEIRRSLESLRVEPAGP